MEFLQAGPFWLFLAGMFGSFAVEVVSGLRASAELDGDCPPKYKKPAYLTFRTLLVLISGVLPIALDAQNAQTAIFIGASAPALLDKLQRGFPANGAPAIPNKRRRT